MSEAKDTVIAKEEAGRVFQVPVVAGGFRDIEDKWWTITKLGLERQAEISFKAGERKVAEVVLPVLREISNLVADIRGDWTDPRSRCRSIHRLIDKCQEFLKSEGIK